MQLHALHNSRPTSQEGEERIHMLSHELRTPLAVISGYAQILEEELGEDQKGLVSPILEGVERLHHVISSLIDWESNSEPFESARSNCDVKEIVDSVVAKLSPLAATKSITIQVEAKESKISSYLASEALRTSVNQLLHNALKFSDSGVVTIQIGVTPQNISVRVIDNGPGLTTPVDRLFEPFVQGSTGLSRKYDGLGLGLALVKKETARLNGNVTLVNGPKTGAIAELCFPRFAMNTTETAPPQTRRLAA